MTEISNDIIYLVWTVFKIALIVVPILVAVALLTLIERRILASIQSRVGPNRAGPLGVFQPIADALKLLLKEGVIPAASNYGMFVLAPVVTISTALAAWAVIPFDQGLVLADVNAGLLFLFAMTSLGVYGTLMAGWGSNSKYALFGALRGAAQTVSYEIAMGFALVGVVMGAGTLNLQSMVLHQSGGIWHWYFIPLLPLFIVYWISAVAETNRTPFDIAETEAEIVAGFHVEYSGMGFALFFLAEYANILLVSAIAALLFFGGWLSPVQGIPTVGPALAWVPGIVWFVLKTAIFVFVFIWMRGTLPRYRYDQLMRLGWKVLIPTALVWIIVVGMAIKAQVGPWFN